MAIGDVYKMTAVFDSSISAKTLTFGIHVRQDQAVWAPQPPMSLFYDWWDAGLGGEPAQKTFHSSDNDLTNIQIRRVQPLEPVLVDSIETFPSAGTGTAATSYSPASATLVSLRTANIGRHYRGRAFLPPPDEADAAGNIVEASAINMAQNFENLRTGLAGVTVGVTLVIFSPANGAWAGAVTPVSSVMVDRRIRTQRRRQSVAVYVTP